MNTKVVKGPYDVPPWDPQTAATSSGRFYYFAYGSNLWQDQMRHRCPQSTLIENGTLLSYRWVISSRGYANVVPSESPIGTDQTTFKLPEDNERITFGAVWTLTQQDMRKLDRYEGTNLDPPSYLKRTCPIIMQDGRTLNCLVYIDPIIDEGPPQVEYIGRINKGLRDAKLPEVWVDGVVRKWIPKDKGLEESEHVDYSTFIQRE